MGAATKTNDQLDRSFLDASIPKLLKELSIDEKISLLAGKDWWTTVPVPRLNIPSVKVTDGPNGARGDSFFDMTPASALPNATAIGATFSRPLVHEAGKLLAKETKARNAVCLLAPTINIQRSPLGGRAFESFSEDPTVSGEIAAAYVNGLQSDGVSATIKHFVANDQEHERMGEDSIVEQRALREIYLRAFQIAQKRSTPWAYMTSYNKLNGTHCSENKWLLQDVLRKEWKHDGLIMSDWYGTYSVSESINAGLNLEMPGETIWRGSKQVQHMILSHKLDVRTLDKVAGEMLTWVQKMAKLNPDLVYAKPSAEKTRTDEKDADAKLLRQLGGEGLVVLKNENEVLPVTGKTKKVAVIGPNAKDRVLTGGGSAMLKSSWSVSPWEGLSANVPEGVELSYALGATTSKYLPALNEDFTALDGSAGFDVAHYAIVDGKQGDKPVVTDRRTDSNLFMADFIVPELLPHWITEVQAIFTAPITGEYEFSLCVTGMGKLWVDDKLVVDASNELEKGSAFFGSGSNEIKGRIRVEKGKQYKIRATHDARSPPREVPVNTPLLIHAVRIGAFQVLDEEAAIAEAAELAKKSDTAVIVAGLNADWESEGYDRPDLSLPLRTNDLIAAVAAANPKTIVVLQAGSAVSMPWINDVAGVVFAWYGGNECGNIIADVVYGKVNPSGRLPISLPVREEDIAAASNYKSARTKIHYEEGIWVGYKHHNERKIAPLFPFGHGLSYTTFSYSDLKVSEPKTGASADDWSIEASVKVKNTGKVAGSHSVHFYLSPPDETATSLRHPQWTLQGFDKVYNLAPGAEETVKVTLDKYAVSHWDEPWKTWRAELGEWTVRIGKDASTMEGEAKFKIEEDLEWTGL